METNNGKIYIESALECLNDPNLRDLSFKYLDIIKKRGFDIAPASRGVHHGYMGGLRDHTEEMLSIAKVLYDGCGFEGVDEDELNISIFFHDAGKADMYKLVDGAYEHNPNSLIFTKPNNLLRPLDHSDIPILDWNELNFDFSWNIRLAILGHMGGWSITGVYPNSLLGSIVASVDLMSSRLGKTEW